MDSRTNGDKDKRSVSQPVLIDRVERTSTKNLPCVREVKRGRNEMKNTWNEPIIGETRRPTITEYIQRHPDIAVLGICWVIAILTLIGLH